MSARASTPTRSLGKALHRFQGDEHGVVAIIFALTLMGVIMFVACAIDIGRATTARVKISGAVDAAAIYAAKELKVANLPLASITPMARALFDQNMVSATKLVTVTNFAMALTADGNGVTVNVDAQVPTTFARAAGITKIDVSQHATAIFNMQDIEVGLQLDVTGSMGEVVGGQTKIASLKAATNNLLDILLPTGGTGTTSVRVGIAPFAAGVNAGSYASVVAGTAAPGNCVYERRTSSADTTDDAPTGADAYMTSNDLTRGAQPCPSTAKLAPLTNDKSSLTAIVRGLSAGGSTAGHLGTSWAWNIVSPNWSGIWPAASKPADYNDGKTLKVAVLMTDGIYNTVNGQNGGDYSATARDSQARAVALCTAMKDKGITIYTVGFIKPGDDPAAANTLIACATDASHFFKAQDGAQLDAAFQRIAKDISRLRLSS